MPRGIELEPERFYISELVHANRWTSARFSFWAYTRCGLEAYYSERTKEQLTGENSRSGLDSIEMDRPIMSETSDVVTCLQCMCTASDGVK